MEVLLTTLPVFGIIILGWAAAAFGIVQEEVERALSNYVFTIALPALIFSVLTGSTVEGNLVFSYWVAYFGGCAIVWVICALFAKKCLKENQQTSLMLGFATSQSNTAFIGIPLILHVYGDEGALPLFMLLAVHLPIMMGAATIIIENKGQVPILQKLKMLVKVLLKNPIFISLILGAIAKSTGFELGSVVHDMVHTVAQTASGCALFALGMAIRRFGVMSRWKDTMLVSVGKLILHPFIVWVLAFHVLSMPPAFAGVATLFAAMPVGINSYLLAARYHSGEAEVAAGVGLSTLLSLVTCSLWIVFLHS